MEDLQVERILLVLFTLLEQVILLQHLPLKEIMAAQVAVVLERLIQEAVAEELQQLEQMPVVLSQVVVVQEQQPIYWLERLQFMLVEAVSGWTSYSGTCSGGDGGPGGGGDGAHATGQRVSLDALTQVEAEVEDGTQVELVEARRSRNRYSKIQISIKIMAHFAKLGINGKVMAVHVVNNSDLLNASGVEDESVGQQFLERLHGWPGPMWIQTSYHTQRGVHKLGGTPLRGTYAGVGNDV